MKKFLLVLIVFISVSNYVEAQEYFYKRAMGLFMSFGVGPRFPIGVSSDEQNLGAGVDVSFSYADNESVPFFVYAAFGYQHFPGRQSYYADSGHSSLSNNVINLDLGSRFYFPALVEDIVLLMPVVEAGASLGIMEKLHEYKIDSGRQDYVEDTSYLGFHVGAGFSMFMLDAVAYYHYFKNNQYLSFDFKVRLPIFVRL